MSSFSLTAVVLIVFPSVDALPLAQTRLQHSRVMSRGDGRPRMRTPPVLCERDNYGEPPPPINQACCSEPAAAFEDYERECFGAGDECELFYYGETPDELQERLARERPEGAMSVEAIRAEGVEVVRRRAAIAEEAAKRNA
mmetsp:Transcript_16024/g.42208  ORF Transcript_16024/g.42208 Transcript_16024/m.42208 type:complete len:141 (-) Transcript_16024:37-459(-)